MTNFICGMLAMVAIESLYQDWLGKEAYLRWADTHWLPAEQTVPMALICLVLAVLAAK